MAENNSALVSMAVRQRWMAGIVLLAGVVAFPLALLLTVGREPGGTVATVAPRSDGCVMFCEDVPKASFRDGNCAQAPVIDFRPWECAPLTSVQAAPKAVR
ncbi:hypothetical protein NBRGN_045_00480 [Nocardia brasiliensis NBRC 14402]|uniref:hypothetical protein n=1 Tax=Nocardia brasiliensis TaxID=37326 RepID=UPI00045D06A0|nr:hypothetical protein [Nocardia brasiliensis]GAJ81948.1 hypothetical protein NBRGN_045_00480 [Nocardia brasiliensis NBRC 14402]SUB55078.1 Uncharacterised protein [Nocardia brasiliensis]